MLLVFYFCCGDLLKLAEYLYQVVETYRVVEVNECEHVAFYALDVLVDWLVGVLGEGGYNLLGLIFFLVIFFELLRLFVIFHLTLLKVLIILIKILRLIRPLTRLYLLLFLSRQLFLLIKHFIFCMRISRFIIHRIVHIDTLMIKQLSKRNHCCVLKVFAKTTRDDVGLDPFYVLQWVCLFVKY